MRGLYPARLSRAWATLFLVGLAFLCGCARPTTPAPASSTTRMPSAGTGAYRVGRTVATCAIWSPADRPADPLARQILFVVWADVPDAQSGSGIDGKHAIYSAFFQPPGGGRVGWEAEMPHGADVSLTINETKYDLAAGKLFLLNIRAGQTQVRQLERDVSQFRLDTGYFQKLAREDEDIARFVAAAEEDK